MNNKINKVKLIINLSLINWKLLKKLKYHQYLAVIDKKEKHIYIR